MPDSCDLQSATPAGTPLPLLAVKAQLMALDEKVGIICSAKRLRPREISVVNGLLADVWESWRVLEAGKRTGLATITELLDRLGKKTQCPGIIQQVELVKKGLASAARKPL